MIGLGYIEYPLMNFNYFLLNEKDMIWIERIPLPDSGRRTLRHRRFGHPDHWVSA